MAGGAIPMPGPSTPDAGLHAALRGSLAPASEPADALCGVLLAAGPGRRWRATAGDDDKLMHPLSDGTPVVVAAARALHSVLPRSVAVVRGDLDDVAAAVEACGLQVIRVPLGELGMGHNIATAVLATRWAEGWVVTLGDMPWTQPHSIAQVAAALHRGEALAAPYFQGTRGHVIGFGASQRADLLHLSADHDVRDLLERHSEQLHAINVDDPGVLLDLDLPDSLLQTLGRGKLSPPP
jgi:molybdenum cofactor cytidylyltransferase